MADQAKNILIGLFVIAASGIAIFILMFLHPRVGDESRKLRVRFSNIDKVSLGTRVTYAGRPVGEVVDIREAEKGREGRHDENDRIYAYELDLVVDSAIHVYNTDEVSVRTSGLLGERNIEITPIAPKPGQPLRIIDEEVIYAAETAGVEDTFRQLKSVAVKFEKALDAITTVVNKIRDEELVEVITQTFENVESITDALNQPEYWDDMLTNLRDLSEKANRSWDKVDTTLDNFTSISADVKDIAHHTHQGEGTIGKLFMRDELYLQTTAIFAKGQTLMNDVNHYGLLFHLDKNWQRLRARRMNLLQKLACPQEFRNFFNDELDLINTSLARVYTLLDETSTLPCFCDILNNREFTKVFSELLRRVNTLEEELRMYNTQLMECEFEPFELHDPCCYEVSCDYLMAPTY